MNKIRRVLLNLTRYVNAKTLPIMIFGLLIGFNLIFAQTGIEALGDVFWGAACDVYGLLLPIAFLLVVAAAVIYAFGQIGSSDMRAKSQSWAMWALVGAIIAFVIILVGPALIGALYGGAHTFPTSTCCSSSCSLSATTIDCSGCTP